MVILFGSYARNDWVEYGTWDGEQSPYISDYDMLIITRLPHTALRIEQHGELRDALQPLTRTPIKLIAHDIGFFNRRLKQGQYFFIDLKADGIALFDSGKCELAEPLALTPQERQQFAQEDFEYWQGKANEFYEAFEFLFGRTHYNIAAFQLHQVVECLYSAVLMVFTHYKPKEHDLEKLSQSVHYHVPRLASVFPRKTDEEKRCFELLYRAYVDARYKKDYCITRDELSYLKTEVDKLMILTKQVCQEKIASFVKQTGER